jgi:Protein of unknown function (DUF3108)
MAWWRMGPAWLAVVAALAPLDAQVPPSRLRRTERPVPFKVGETLDYDVSWSGLLTAGTATLKVQEKKASYGSTAYYIYAEGRPTPLIAKFYPVYYKVDTLLDAYTLLPQRGATYSDEHGQRKLKVFVFNRPGGTADYEVQSGAPEKTRLSVPPLTQDALSAVMAMRAAPLLEGGRLSMHVVNEGRLYAMKVTVGGKELMSTGAGWFKAWRLTPTLVDAEGQELARGVAIWISDDARHLPVKLEAELAVGKFVLTLRGVKP